MVLPNPTLRCCTPSFAKWQIIAHAITFKSNTVPRVTNLCSGAHVAHKGSPWHSLKRCIHKDLNKCVCVVCACMCVLCVLCVRVCVCCVCVTCTYSGVDMYQNIRTYINSFKRACMWGSGTSWYVIKKFQTQTNMSKPLTLWERGHVACRIPGNTLHRGGKDTDTHTHVCTKTHTHVRARKQTHGISTRSRTHAHARADTHARTHPVHTHAHTPKQTRTHAHARTQTHTCHACARKHARGYTQDTRGGDYPSQRAWAWEGGREWRLDRTEREKGHGV